MNRRTALLNTTLAVAQLTRWRAPKTPDNYDYVWIVWTDTIGPLSAWTQQRDAWNDAAKYNHLPVQVQRVILTTNPVEPANTTQGGDGP